jgi:calcium-dependent protein kinase
MDELVVMQNLDHPNIVKFFEVFEDKFQFHLVMEYCQGGDLSDLLSDL